MINKIHKPVRDICQSQDKGRKYDEKTFFEIESKFRQIFHCVNNAIAIYEAFDEGTDFIIKEFNQAAEQFTHVSRNAVLGQRVSRVFPDIERFGLMKILQHVWKTGIPEHLPANLYRDQRLEFWAENYVFKLSSGEIVAIFQDVTKYKEAEEKLKESDEFSRKLLEQSPNPILVQNPDTSIVYVNPACERVTGYTLSEMIGKKAPYLYWPEEYREEYLQKMQYRLSQNQFPPDISEFQKKSGERFWVEISASLTKDANGKLSQIITNYIDITERRKAEEKNKQLAELVRSSNDAIYGTTLEGVLTSWNKGAENIFGYTESEVVGKPLSMLVPPNRQSRIPWVGEKIRLGEHFDGLEVTYLRKGGKEIDIVLTISPVFEEEGKIASVSSVARDVTALKRVEKALRETERINSSLLANSPNPIVVLKADTAIFYVNKAFEKVTGFSSAEVINIKPPFPWWKPEHYATYTSQTRKAMQKGCIRQERLIRKKNGEDAWIEYDHVSIIEDGEVKYYLSMWVDKTERKKAEEQLVLSEKKYSTLVEKGNDGVIIIQDGLLKFVNSKIIEVTGYSSEESLGKQFIDFVSPAYRPVVVETYRKRIADVPTPDKYEIEILAKDGRTIPVEISASIIEYEGRPADMAIVRDISERKKAEEELIRLSNAMKMTSEIVVISDMEGKIKDVNDAFLRICGCDDKMELIGKSGLEFVTREDLKKILRSSKAIVENSSSLFFECHVLTKDNKKLLVQGSSAIMKDRIGKPSGIVSVLRDITDHRKMEDQIKHAAEEWRITFDSIPDLVSIIDRNLKLVRVNLAFANNLGSKPNNLIGRFCYEVQLGRNSPCEDCYLLKVLKTRLPSVTEVSSPDQSIFEMGVSPIFDKNGEVEFCVRVARDITDQKKMREQLRLSDRLASIGELAAGIAHELNNPLTSVVGFSQLVLEAEVPPGIKDDLKVVNNEAQRAAKIVKNLLTFARKHSPVKQSNQINDCINEVLSLRAYELKCQNIKVINRLEADLPRVMFDYFQMQQVFINLIINAEFFMVQANNGGTLIITTEKSDGIIRISIADDGPGITQDDLNHLFSPFFTTKEVGKGTGLGLSICHGIVSEHGGKIFARSETGKGATFIIEMPG